MTRPWHELAAEQAELKQKVAAAKAGGPTGSSADRRRTARNNALLESGIHPAGNRPLLERRTTQTCGNCKHLTGHRRNRAWFKCGLLPVTHGAGTDIRLKWPACRDWKAADDG